MGCSRNSPTLALGVLLLAGNAAAGSAAATFPGYYLEEEMVKLVASGVPQVESTRTWLVAGRMRKEQSPSGSVTIFREDRRSIWVLDTRRKTYFSLSRDALDRMGQLGMSAVAGDAGSPSGPSPGASQSPGDGSGAGEWLKKTGNKKRIGAWECYEVRAEDRPLPGTRISLWLSAGVPIDKALRDQFGSGTLSGGSAAGKLLAGLKGLEGYPVEVQLSARLGNQILELRQTLKKVEKVEAAAELFEPPRDYREVDNPLEEPPPPAGVSPVPH